MTTKQRTPPLLPRKRTRPAALLAASVAVAAALGCSVYDSSLLGSNAGLNDNGGDTQSGPDASAGTATTGGGGSIAGGEATTGGVTDVGGGGSDPGMPDAGETTGGTAGKIGNTAGLGGMPVSGGKSGAGGTTATGGSSGKGGGSSGGSGGSGGNGGSGGVLHELANGKNVTASSAETGNEATHANDGSMTTRWCANGGMYPQWWRVDLGASHQLVKASISFEHPDRKYFYLVETSSDDAVYTQQVTASGTAVTQNVAIPPGVNARYVRVTVTNASPLSVNSNGTWASFWEFTLQGY